MSTSTTNATPRSVTLAEYKALRYGEGAEHPLMPRSVTAIRHDLSRLRSGAADAYAAEQAALGIDLDYSSKVKPYGGYVSAITLPADEVVALGFDPEHLTARVTVAYSDFYDTPETMCRAQGFDFERAGNGRSGYGWEHHEEEDRPTHESVRVDYSGPRDRSNYHWVTLGQSSQKYWLCGNAWNGMSKSVRAQVRHEVLLRVNERQAAYVGDWMNDEIKNFDVVVEVYWRGEEVGSASLGGCEMTDNWRTATDEIADFILGDALLDEALDEAAKWADKAVADAQQRAAKIVGDIALLPERSIAAVRDTFTTAKVIRKTA